MRSSYSYYLTAGAAIEAKIRSGSTALLRAADRGHESVVQLLPDRGAAIGAKRSERLDGAVVGRPSRHKAIVQRLLDRGAAIEAKDQNGSTALSLAADRGDEAVVQLLLNRGAIPSASAVLRGKVKKWFTSELALLYLFGSVGEVMQAAC